VYNRAVACNIYTVVHKKLRTLHNRFKFDKVITDYVMYLFFMDHGILELVTVAVINEICCNVVAVIGHRQHCEIVKYLLST